MLPNPDQGNPRWLILFGFFLLILTGVLWWSISLVPKSLTTKSTRSVACSEEVKICPDGSRVGRTGQNCEFSECPNAVTNIGPTHGDVVVVKYYFQVIPVDGLCANVKLFDIQDRSVLSTLKMCEDNVANYSDENGKILLTTDCGRTYTRNLATGQEKIDEPITCRGLGSLTVVPVSNNTNTTATNANTTDAGTSCRSSQDCQLFCNFCVTTEYLRSNPIWPDCIAPANPETRTCACQSGQCTVFP